MAHTLPVEFCGKHLWYIRKQCNGNGIKICTKIGSFECKLKMKPETFTIKLEQISRDPDAVLTQDGIKMAVDLNWFKFEVCRNLFQLSMIFHPDTGNDYFDMDVC